MDEIKAIIEGKEYVLKHQYDSLFAVHFVELGDDSVDYEYDRETGICRKGYTELGVGYVDCVEVDIELLPPD